LIACNLLQWNRMFHVICSRKRRTDSHAVGPMVALLLIGSPSSAAAQGSTWFESQEDRPPRSAPAPLTQPSPRAPSGGSVRGPAPATQQDLMVNVCASFTRGMDRIEFWHMCPFPIYVAFCLAQANIYRFTCEAALKHGAVQVTYLPVSAPRAMVQVSGTDVLFKACAEPRVPRISGPIGTFGPAAMWSCN
jgi:hypothetical protein